MWEWYTDMGPCTPGRKEWFLGPLNRSVLQETEILPLLRPPSDHRGRVSRKNHPLIWRVRRSSPSEPPASPDPKFLDTRSPTGPRVEPDFPQTDQSLPEPLLWVRRRGEEEVCVGPRRHVSLGPKE